MNAAATLHKGAKIAQERRKAARVQEHDQGQKRRRSGKEQGKASREGTVTEIKTPAVLASPK